MERCPGCDVPTTCSQRVTLNVKGEYAKPMERLGLKPGSGALVKGVKGVISREKTVEAMEKGILRAVRDIFVFKDGTTRFDMIDLPLTHICPDEVKVSVEKLRSLGYVKDYRGYDLQNGSQIVELRPQDLLTHRCRGRLPVCAGYGGNPVRSQFKGQLGHRGYITPCLTR